MTKHIPGRAQKYTLDQGFSVEQLQRFEQRGIERLIRPDDELAEKRLLAVFEMASAGELIEGLEWYKKAREYCSQLAGECNRVSSSRHAAGIVAALSPRTSWAENLRRVELLVRTGRTYGTDRSIADARAILYGEDPTDVLCDPKRSNYKISAFYTNMAHPDSDAVTIDRHGLAMLYDDSGIGSILLRLSREMYEWAEDRFRTSADATGLAPCDFQAITWVVWRNKKKERVSRNMPTLF